MSAGLVCSIYAHLCRRGSCEAGQSAQLQQELSRVMLSLQDRPVTRQQQRNVLLCLLSVHECAKEQRSGQNVSFACIQKDKQLASGVYAGDTVGKAERAFRRYAFMMKNDSDSSHAVQTVLPACACALSFLPFLNSFFTLSLISICSAFTAQPLSLCARRAERFIRLLSVPAPGQSQAALQDHTAFFYGSFQP